MLSTPSGARSRNQDARQRRRRPLTDKLERSVAEVSVSTWLVRRSALHRNPEGRRDELSTSDVRRGRSGILIAAPGAVPSELSHSFSPASQLPRQRPLDDAPSQRRLTQCGLVVARRLHLRHARTSASVNSSHPRTPHAVSTLSSSTPRTWLGWALSASTTGCCARGIHGRIHGASAVASPSCSLSLRSPLRSPSCSSCCLTMNSVWSRASHGGCSCAGADGAPSACGLPPAFCPTPSVVPRNRRLLRWEASCVERPATRTVQQPGNGSLLAVA